MTMQIASIKLSFSGVFTFIVAVVLNGVSTQSISNECGIINIPKGLSLDANQTHKGFWPFAVAIYEIKGYKPFCGGTLISRKHVLTAAHCVHDTSIGLKYDSSEIAVLLGAFVLLNKSESGLSHVNVTEILFHPDWKMFSKNNLNADLAILVLNNSVTLSNDIQIVCLPSDEDVIDYGEGFVVGWDLVQQTPKHSVISVFNSSDCFNDDLLMSSADIATSRTSCGGAGKVLPTKKISGGGFFIGSGTAWVLHGIAVSITNATVNSTDQTVVALMNVISFKNWIAEVVKHSGGVIGEAIKGKSNLECNFSDLYYTYACVAYGLNVLSRNFVVDKLIGTHESKANNNKVELIQFHNGTMLYLLDGIGKLFPNLKSVFVGYSDSVSLKTVLIRRSNFQHMENVFEIGVHKSNIDTIADDLLWDLPRLERFQLDGKLKELPERIFEKNTELTEVYLASNALVFLPSKLFRNNLNLNWVNFENNFLKFIEVDFTVLPNIQYVFLSGNDCVNQNFNKTAELIEYQHENRSKNDDSYPVKRLQRLIYSNCTFFTL